MSLRLDISGPKGNAFYILGLVNRLGSAAGMDKDEISSIQDEMTGQLFVNLGGQSTDYDHLVRTFSKYFPMVELYSARELPMDPDLYVLDNSGDMEL